MMCTGDAMQAHRIAVRLTVPVTPGLLHQLRNCAEEIYRALRDVRYARVENADTAIDTIWVRVVSTGKVRQTLKVVEKCVADELLWDRCETSVYEADGFDV